MFEDRKMLSEAVNRRRTDNTMRKGEKKQTMKPKNLKTEQH